MPCAKNCLIRAFGPLRAPLVEDAAGMAIVSLIVSFF